jgi:hypothetical protein
MFPPLSVSALSKKKQNILPTKSISLTEESSSCKSPELLYTILMQHTSCNGTDATIRSYIHWKDFYINLSKKIEDERIKIKQEIEEAKMKKRRHCLCSCIHTSLVVKQKEKKLHYLDSGKVIYTC